LTNVKAFFIYGNRSPRCLGHNCRKLSALF
jgi:hypothetical protein